MERIGERLRRRREELGLTLDDVAEATKFRQETINAIEEGRTGVFDADAYLKAFLSAYASVLGLDPRDIIREQKSEEERVYEAIKEIKLRPPRKISLRRTLVWLCVVAVAAAAIVVLFDRVLRGRGARDRQVSASETALTVAADEEGRQDTAGQEVHPIVDAHEGVDEASGGPVSAVDATKDEVLPPEEIAQEIGVHDFDSENAKSKPGEQSSRLEVLAHGGVLLTLATGDSIIFNGYLTGGDRKSFESDKPFVLVFLSDRYAISLILDDEQVRLPESHGRQISDLTLPWNAEDR